MDSTNMDGFNERNLIRRVSPLVEDKPVRATRKKFATPPVKLACLECRASRTRCDGKHECGSVSPLGG
jgi:hypothetical protein